MIAVVDDNRKEVSPLGGSSGVYACSLGRELLKGEKVGWWEETVGRRVVVGEGGPDFLALATYWSECDVDAPAVFGVFSGAWSPEIAQRIPNGSVVFVATDPDAGGAALCSGIVDSLSTRCDVRVRWEHLR